jgi:alpha-N-acetylglucosamine transferase
MISDSNIVLVLKSGGDFSLRDVYLLSTHIHKTWDRRELPSPRIYCIYDKIQQPISTVGLDLIPMKYKWPGWWAKMNLFSPELVEIRPFLYLDLDTAVLKSIHELFKLPQYLRDSFITLEDFYRKGVLASGMMWIANNEETNKIWRAWIANPEQNMKTFRGDQDFIGSFVDSVFFQSLTKQIGSFKPLPDRLWKYEVEDKDAVICFHGYPRIPKAAETVNWVNNYVNLR